MPTLAPQALARPLALIGLAALLCACGGGPTAVRDPDGPKNQARPLPPPGTFESPGLEPFAAVSGWSATPLETEVVRTIGRALEPPPALDCLAREYATRFAADGRDPDPGTVAALARHCGYWTVPRKTHAVTAPDEAKLMAHVRRLPPAAFEGTIGVGLVADPAGPLTLAILHDPGEVRFDAPLARQTEAPAPLDGRLVGGDGALEMWIDDAEGPRRIELAVADAGRFSATVPAGATRVELARRQGRFLRTVALFDRAPRPERYAPPPPAGPPADARQTAEALVAAINARRRAAGLATLTHETRLDPVLGDWLHRVAERNADDSPPGMLDERGWPFARLRYAIAAGRDAEQIAALLVDAPTGRRAVLTDEVDRVAVGLRPFAGGSGFDAVFAAVRGFTPTPPAEARRALLDGLNAARAQDGMAPLRDTPTLDALAQTLAEEALSGRRAWDTVVPGAMGGVAEGKLVSGGFAAGAFATPTLEQAPFASEPGAMQPGVTRIGIGVAGGPLPGGGAPRYLVVYIVAEAIPAHDI